MRLRLPLERSPLLPLAPHPSALYLTLLALAMTLLPHTGFQPLWISALAYALIGWRALVEWRGWRLPPLSLRLALYAATLTGILLSFHALHGREAGTAFLLGMLALKLLETRTRRDLVVVIFIGYFGVITTFLFSETLPVALWMVAATVTLTAALIATHQLPTQGRQRAGRPQLATAGALLLQALPLMLILFLLFPRHTGPLWGLPEVRTAAVTGLSDTMQPGSINQLVFSDAVAFRADFADAPPPAGQLYWRGPVLTHTDGRSWRATPLPPGQPPRATPATAIGSYYDYTVILEAHGERWVLALDVPLEAPSGATLIEGYQLISRETIDSRSRFQLRSAPQWRSEPLTPEAWLDALQLPDGYHPRARALANQLTAGSDNDQERVARVLAHFRDQPFYYTERPPLLLDDPVDQFLFEAQRGFCEHYAAAFTVLMRAAGVPARVVTGYHGGQVNPLGNHLTVRQSDAHAWSEVWLEGRGWTRVDPTSVIPPSRVELSQQTQRIREPAFDGRTLDERPAPHWQPSGLDHLRMGWDSVNHRWNRWVLGYSREEQERLFGRLGWPQLSLRGLLLTLLLAVGIAAVATFALLQLLGRERVDKVSRPWRRLLQRLARHGHRPERGEPPTRFAQRIEALQPSLAPQLSEIAALYTRLRYGRDTDPADLSCLRRMVRRLRV